LPGALCWSYHIQHGDENSHQSAALLSNSLGIDKHRGLATQRRFSKAGKRGFRVYNATDPKANVWLALPQRYLD
jgi:hypothetical protein